MARIERWKEVTIAGEEIIVRTCQKDRETRRRAKKNRPSKESVIKSNKRQLTRRIHAIIEENFKVGDLYITFTYKPEERPEERESAKSDVEKFIRKLRAAYRADGQELKAIWAIEDERLFHTHMVLNKPGKEGEKALNTWSIKGNFWRDEIHIREHANEKGEIHQDFYYLARYLVKEKTKHYDKVSDFQEKAYSRTRNLREPEVRKYPLKHEELQIAIPEGYRLIDGSIEEYTDPLNGDIYRTYRLRCINGRPYKRWTRGKKARKSEIYHLEKNFIEEQMEFFREL